MFEIRRATASDIECITELFYETIQNVNIKDYTQEQVDDWSSWRLDVDKWKDRISKQYFIVASLESKIIGFSSIAKDGYLDFMFTHKDFQGKGVAGRMLVELERKAMEQKNLCISSDVSITAKRFFLSRGYEIEEQQLKKSRNKELINFKMRKQLSQ